MSMLFAQIEQGEVEFLITNAVVEQYPYRAKLLGAGVFMTMSRSALVEFEQKLANASGKLEDNHTVYSIVQEDCPALYVQFADDEVRFGLTIR